MSTTVRLLIETREGKPVHEEVHVEDRGAGTYRLLQSPGLVLGLAADDVFLVQPDDTFQLLQRGGNIAIQMFSEHPLDRIEPPVSSELARIGGRLDGKAPNLLVYTVSVKICLH